MSKSRDGAPACDALLALNGAELERLIGSVTMPEASGEWISAREARLLVSRTAVCTLPDAERALCRRALRWLRVQPHTWSRHEVPHEGIPRAEFFKDKREPDLSHFSDKPSRTAWEEGLALFEAIGTYADGPQLQDYLGGQHTQ